MRSAWGGFVLVATLIAWSGARGVRAAEALAESTGLGRVWVGAILVAAVTSLPELITGGSSVTIADTLDLAVGRLLGSCVFNLALLALADFADARRPLDVALDRSHVVAAGFGLVIFAIVGLGLATPASYGSPVVARFAMPLLLPVYLMASLAIRRDTRPDLPARSSTSRLADPRDLGAFALGSSVVGLLVAASTLPPEIAVTLHAARTGAADLAVGNLLGSNLFHMLTASAVTAVFVIALARRLRARRLGIGSGASIRVLLLFLANSLRLSQRKAAP